VVRAEVESKMTKKTNNGNSGFLFVVLEASYWNSPQLVMTRGMRRKEKPNSSECRRRKRNRKTASCSLLPRPFLLPEASSNSGCGVLGDGEHGDF